MNVTSNFFCDCCNYSTFKKNNYKRHMQSKKHKKNYYNNPKQNKYSCQLCLFTTTRKTEMTRHVKTLKHINNIINNKMDDNNDDKITTNKKVCDCGKQYKYLQSYYKHIENCSVYNNKNENKIDDSDFSLNNTHNKVLKQLMQKCESLEGKIVNNNISIVNNTIINHNHNNYNMNIFLNETCKDAMNISDFVNSIKLKQKTWNELCTENFFDFLGNLIVDNLKEMDISKRPIHCADVNNNIMYIKDRDFWEQDKDQNKIKQTVDVISTKQKACDINAVNDWINNNSEWKKDINKVKEFMKGTSHLMHKIEKSKEEHILNSISSNTIINDNTFKKIKN